MRYKLTSDGIMNPSWFNSVRSGEFPAVVTAEGHVELKGVTLRFMEAINPTLPWSIVNPDAQVVDNPVYPAPGTEVMVHLNRWFFAETVADQMARRAAAAAEQQLKDERRRVVLNQKREAARLLNAGLSAHLPVAWEPAIKDVLSGLTEHSMANGRSNSTVQHIRLLGPLAVGRLKREKGDMLCTASAGTNGKGWSNEAPSIQLDGDGGSYLAPVTCKKCLELAGRLPQVSPLFLSAATGGQLNISPGFLPGFIDFDFGTCRGNLHLTDTTYGIVAVVNEAHGNGDFKKLLAHFEALGRQHSRDVVVLDICNPTLLGHLVNNYGYKAVEGTRHALLPVGGPGTCPEEYLHEECNELLDGLLDFLVKEVGTR